MIHARSFAKINLYLDVRTPRPDGFHDIETVFQTIDLCDTLRFESAPNELTLTCSDPTLDCGPSNLVMRAAAALREHSGIRFGAGMRLDKKIPVAAGLAGGSGNAAAALRGLSALWNVDVPETQLQHLALSLGSDVPYCLIGGTVAARGRGEIMQPLLPLRELWFVLVHPELSVSTKAIYTHPNLRRNEEAPIEGWTKSFRIALQKIESGDYSGGVFNAMEPVVFEMHRSLSVIKTRLLEAGCVAAAMSGSGPTMFGVAENSSAAEQVALAMREDGLKVTLTTPVSQGIGLDASAGTRN